MSATGSRPRSLGFELQAEASLGVLTNDVVRSAAIEGERLDERDVRSSIARRLGLPQAGVRPQSRDVEGIVEVMLDATNLEGAIDQADSLTATVLRKADIWRMLDGGPPVNDRQRLVLNRLLDGFEGGLTSSKYAKLATCSADTALRDILDLVTRGVLTRTAAGGHSTSYRLAGNPGA
ncbi:MAG: DUF4172 domain-containing protein [Planctomycetaceae bacterium]